MNINELNEKVMKELTNLDVDVTKVNEEEKELYYLFKAILSNQFEFKTTEDCKDMWYRSSVIEGSMTEATAFAVLKYYAYLSRKGYNPLIQIVASFLALMAGEGKVINLAEEKKNEGLGSEHKSDTRPTIRKR